MALRQGSRAFRLRLWTQEVTVKVTDGSAVSKSTVNSKDATLTQKLNSSRGKKFWVIGLHIFH